MATNGADAERQPLLSNGANGSHASPLRKFVAFFTPKRIAALLAATVFVVGAIVFAVLYNAHEDAIRRDPYKSALAILDSQPLIVSRITAHRASDTRNADCPIHFLLCRTRT